MTEGLGNKAIPGGREAFVGVITREWILAFRRRGDIANPLVFALIVITLFPLGLGPESSVLARLAPGLVWVVALLACLLSVDRIFRDDYLDGSLQQLMLSPQSPYFLLLARGLAFWLASGVPVTLLSPLLGMMLALPAGGYWPLFWSLLMGTVSLGLIGAIGAALTVGLKRGGVLVALIVLPLYVPVLVFGASAVNAGSQGLPYGGHLAVLAAFMLLTLVLSPLAIAAGLKINLDG